MASLHWVPFHTSALAIGKLANAAVQEAVKELSAGKWWTEPTSFLVFQSDRTIDTIASHFRAALDPDQEPILTVAGRAKPTTR